MALERSVPLEEKHITWHCSAITKSLRQKQNEHKSAVLWFTGLSGSGKSTIANAVQAMLFKRGIQAYLLDGDNLRHGINGNLSFSQEDRKENIRRTAEMAKLFSDAGFVVLASLISPYKADRKMARELMDEGEFIEIYIDCPVEECEKRDPKGLYKKVRNGEIKGFTGIDDPYEKPEKPEIILHTGKHSLEECVQSVMKYLDDVYELKTFKEE
ncbi:adenylyl-sulfate kinase [Bacillus infantis]|uniref:Adenylyl-sulfate kinase n=1 Tax=Bacillus infantis TaxID=324767 RepID=A0A5D4STG9_9BACI|nr:adenylyl-sulfate kinase [Bacillus infantis]OXT14939.1 adenylyl-sulfate kinase [Bacillus sp. OG2]TYS65404.1 adenylyl-sulfate kinase [Bacillus infantis]